MRTLRLLAAAILAVAATVQAEVVRTDVPYRTDAADPATTRPAVPEMRACLLDVRTPDAGTPVRATLVYFHGGGLTGGNRAEIGPLAKVLTDRGVAVVSADYRLSSATVHDPDYIDDAAAAVAWTFRHCGDFGGSADRIFVGGYSAGGFLTMILGSDDRRLAPFGLKPQQLAGLVAFSPQTSTHFQILAERGIAHSKETSVVDDDAPLRHASAEMPRVLSFIGDHDWPARAEELDYFFALLRVQHHPDATLVHVADRTHGSIFGRAPEPGDPVGTAMLTFLLEPPATTRPTAAPDAP